MASLVFFRDACIFDSICSRCMAMDPRKGSLTCCESGGIGLAALAVVPMLIWLLTDTGVDVGGVVVVASDEP